MIDKSWLGKAEIRLKEDVIAGSLVTWKLTYYVGKSGIDDGGSIRISFRGDSERPQFDNPKGSGYTTVSTNADVRLIPKYGRLHIRPWFAAVQIDVRDGSLKEGDQVILTLGDKSAGGPGIRAQTFRETEHIFKVLVDWNRTGKFEEIEKHPHIRIIGGPVHKIHVIAPSDAVIGKSIPVTVSVIDSWGNLSDVYRGKIYFSSSDPNSEILNGYEFTGEDNGSVKFDNVVLKSPEVHYITVKDDLGNVFVSNPIMVRKDDPNLRLYWGDIHGQTRETVGTGTPDEYFGFLRDIAAMDFGSWQGNDFQVTKELWENVCEKTKEYNDPGKFILFLGYEWSGLTPYGGDHNVYYLNDDEKIYRSGHSLIDDKSDEDTDRYPISKLWETFKGRKDVMAIPHVGGRYANFDYFDPERIPLVEVYSGQGTYNWFLEEALTRGFKVGFVANSDNHTCQPGLAYPMASFDSSRRTRGGYTAIYAKELNRESLWEALWSRRCYATTGERIILWVEIDGHIMGEEFTINDHPKIQVKVMGTTPLHEVEIKRGLKTIYRHPFAKPQGEDRLIKIEWSGHRVKSRNKSVDWSGGLFINKGRIVSYQKYAFDDPIHEIRQITNQRLEWTSTTGGDPDGVILNLDAPNDTRLSFYSKPITFLIDLENITNDPCIMEADEVEQQVKITTISNQQLPKNLEFSYIDSKPKNGNNSYWVKVTQSDGNMAWSSPLFVYYKP